MDFSPKVRIGMNRLISQEINLSSYSQELSCDNTILHSLDMEQIEEGK
jgi:hypothetical protein